MLFIPFEYSKLVCVNKLGVHPYFTRSKGPTDYFSRQSSRKGKITIGDNNEEIRLTDVVVTQPAISYQNKLIMQQMQQNAEMRVEM